jgi:GT2 family glycosyltransferase
LDDATCPRIRRPPPAAAATVGAVVIGRNEGRRLEACLTSLRGRVARTVYVDSGSTDGSVAAARRLGAEVVELDGARPFTAARARNAGLAALTVGEAPDYVQFVDGDCTVDPGWIAGATLFLEARPGAAVVCGRRRERFPEASVYNRLCDWEWDTPVGPARACGGDALIRKAAVVGVGGYCESLIAGEEPELCLRLRRAGWEIWRTEAEMTTHDAAIHRFGQWWRRSRRAGYAFAEGAALHGAAPERHWVAETRRALAWSILPPAAAALFAPLGAMALIPLLAYPLQVARLAARQGLGRRASWERAGFTVLAKFPEALGVAEFRLMRLRGGRELIEYK